MWPAPIIDWRLSLALDAAAFPCAQPKRKTP